ncbi:MAG: 4-hydroxy-tetrahydrodipicolinate reductase [Dehalococcoidales bacterium]|nr:4-hydroxy-tetrahydrodipicolinate reductase [Dehalococcoidales bacterium]
MEPVKVVVFGAAGRVGQVLINGLVSNSEVKLVGAVDARASSEKMVLGDGVSIPYSPDLEKIIDQVQPEVMVDFTLAPATMPAARIAASRHVNLVIGTTGLSAADITELDELAQSGKIGIILASNFALGAVLMMYFAKLAARYMDCAEIIELHHNQKIDAPSGTALNTARAMAAAREKPFIKVADEGNNFPSRGEKTAGIPVHSVRLPGLMAHQEVLLGAPGQTLSIRHDTINRECYIPGVLMAIREVVKRPGLTQGLEKLLGLP